MSGKGSKPRPIAVDQETYASNWDAIFSASRLGANPTSKAGNESSILSGAAIDAELMTDDLRRYGLYIYKTESGRMERVDPATIYIDNETGAQVTEEWWPGDPV